MTVGARYLYLALAWALVAAILLQVYFVGLGLFAGSENLELHATFGWLLHLAPLPVLLSAAFAGAGRRRILQAIALTVVIFFVPILAAIRADLPLAAAFHPVGAVLAFLLAVVVARGATTLVRTETADRTTLAEWAVVVLLVVLVLMVSLTGSPEAG